MVVELPYSLHGRYPAIAIAWTVIIIPPIFINLGLFYGLWYGKPQMDRIAVLTIPTAVLGIFTAIAIVERIWKLIQPSPEFRPLKSPRYALDIFQWGYFAALIMISALISSTLARGDNDQDGHELQTRLISMPAPVLMYFLATLTLLSLILNGLKVKLPFQFGSLGAGNVVRPAIYYIVEDVVAVDGNGGMEYREAFTARYDNSLIFRKMIWILSVVWMLAFYIFATTITVLVFTLPKAAVYAVGWAAPFPLAGIMALCTIYYVKFTLRQERRAEESDDNRVPLDGQTRRALSSSEDERTPLLGR
ncbi:hypothetical protein BP6252_03893 [Coleophoma cylindrospora]|uniref:Uncharacterized protein n=1 Tax=Coleophoma cylindrospora TaxID=1849047 RepID=A0A3D8S9G6_9HELO|nr:hypothetical protein BP6252_03893 [Coleophoma cylindrospora]